MVFSFNRIIKSKDRIVFRFFFNFFDRKELELEKSTYICLSIYT